MDDGLLGEFKTVLSTVDRQFFVAKDKIVRGRSYRFRYKVKNVTGWSFYSDVAYIFAFSIPDRPVRPTFVQATDTSATL